MRVATCLLVVVSLLVPASLGHASPDPLEVETQLLADDTDDSYANIDGFDIQDVYIREVEYSNIGAGIVFRVYLYGGFAPESTASSLPLEIDVSAGGTAFTRSATTSDGTNWTSANAIVLEAEFEEESPGVLQGYVQIFLPLDELGIAIGDTVGPFTVRTYADSDLRDISPGGRPVPGTNGASEIPAENSVTRDSITLVGPLGYTKSSVKFADETGEIAIQNLITGVGQHIRVKISQPDGWVVDQPDPVISIVEAGEHPVVTFTAVAEPGSDDATIFIGTDLGGMEELSLPSSQVKQTTSNSGASEDGSESNEDKPTQFPAALASFCLLGMAVILRRHK